MVSTGSHDGYPGTVLGYRVTWCPQDPMRDIFQESLGTSLNDGVIRCPEDPTREIPHCKNKGVIFTPSRINDHSKAFYSHGVT